MTAVWSTLTTCRISFWVFLYTVCLRKFRTHVYTTDIYVIYNWLLTLQRRENYLIWWITSHCIFVVCQLTFQVVFVPVWIILTLLSVCVLYYIIWAFLFMRSPEITSTQRNGHLVNSFMSCFIVIPLLTFMVSAHKNTIRYRITIVN